MDTRRVEGIYPTIDEALRAVNRLRDEGYPRNNITLVANEDIRNAFTSDLNTESIDEADDNHSLWDKIKDAFTTDDSYDDPDYDVENDPLDAYRSEIREGQVAILVSGEPGVMDTGLAADSELFDDEEAIPERPGRTVVIDPDLKNPDDEETHTSPKIDDPEGPEQRDN